jgi:hypothetical protein
MDPAELLDYALGRLDGPRRERLERELALNSTLAKRLKRVICNLDRLLDDGRERYALADCPPSPAPPPSPDLVGRDRPEDE